jgi:hypothetical protein
MALLQGKYSHVLELLQGKYSHVLELLQGKYKRTHKAQGQFQLDQTR